MDIKTQLKQILLNQQTILTNQVVLLKEITSKYDPDTNEATAEHCVGLIFRMSQTENDIYATKTILKEID